MTYKVIQSDIMDFKHEGEPFQGIITDSPYGLAFMGKSWDTYDPREFQEFVRQWGSHVLSMVYPATILLGFGGTRTYHRFTCGLEDAGWEIFDSIIAWTYGNGFPKSHNSKDYEGYGTALKPSYEPIVIARSPRQGFTYADCLERWGTGSLWIDGTRVLIGEQWGSRPTMDDIRGDSFNQDNPQIKITRTNHQNGRWGGNTILTHHPDCSDEQCHPDCHVVTLGGQSGVSVSSGGGGQSLQGIDTQNGIYGNYPERNRPSNIGLNDTGTASRFFYQPKSPRWERDKGVSKQAQIVRGKSRYVQNHHPTVKPIQLTTYLGTLIRPPLEHESRRLLVPFSGSGSEMIGGHFGGWTDITGVEREPEYIRIANERLKWWTQFQNYEEAEFHHKNKSNQKKLL